MVKKDTHRALGSSRRRIAGAYEAGVFNALYYWIKKESDAEKMIIYLI